MAPVATPFPPSETAPPQAPTSGAPSSATSEPAPATPPSGANGTPPGLTPSASTSAAPSSSRGSFFRLHAMDACYAKEMLMPMTLGLIVLMLVMAGNFVYWAINSIVNQGMSALPVLKLFLLALPGFAVQGIPAGVILAVCLVLNRAVRDNEVLALRVGGASLPRIVAPLLVMALLASVTDYLVVEKVAPVTNVRAENLLAKIMSSDMAPLIEADRYFRAGPYCFYVGTIENSVMHQVMVYQRATNEYSSYAPSVYPLVYLADSAHENPRRKGEWILENVVIHSYDSTGKQLMEAHQDAVKINIRQQLSNFFGEQKDAFSMHGDELSQKIQELKNSAVDSSQLTTYQVEFWRRFALPGACFVMALCAAPLALRYARHGSFAGLVSAFLLAFLWQGFDGWFRALGIAGYLQPIVAAWGTNALFLLFGIVLMARER